MSHRLIQTCIDPLTRLVLICFFSTQAFAQTTPSRFAVGLDGSYLPTTSRQDWARWGIVLRPRVRVGPHGQLGLNIGYHLNNRADAIPSRNGAELYEDLFLLQLSYEYLIPLQGAVRPYLGFSIGPAFVSERSFTDGNISILRETSKTAPAFQIPFGALIRVSPDVQLHLGVGFQGILLDKQAILQWPVSFGVRVGRL